MLLLQVVYKFASLVCPEGLSVTDGAAIPWWTAAAQPGAQKNVAKKASTRKPGREPNHKIWDNLSEEWVDDPNLEVRWLRNARTIACCLVSDLNPALQ